MAKTGFPYYRAETDRFQDIRIKRLKKEFHGDGYAVYSYILNEIYRVQGCFLQWDECTVFDVAEYWGLKESKVGEIVKYCGAVGLFDKELLTNGRVITSRSIQSRYIDMCKLTKRMPKIPDKICLLSEELPKNSDKSQETPSFSANSKVKENIEEKKREYPPLTPPAPDGALEEGDFFSSSLSAKDGKPRNYNGLLQGMKRLNIPQEEQDQIMKLSGYGIIGHPVWQYLNQALASIGKSDYAKNKIRLPGKFILSKLIKKNETST